MTISTRSRRVLVVLGAIVGALIALRVIAAAIWPTINDVRTGATPEHPTLDMGLEITAQAPEKGEIQAVAVARDGTRQCPFALAQGTPSAASLSGLPSRLPV